jgi:hypothetical protein
LLSAKSFASPLPIPDVAPIIIAFFILNFVCLLCRPTMRHNGLRAGDRSPVLSRSFGTAGLWRLHAVKGWLIPLSL